MREIFVIVPAAEVEWFQTLISQAEVVPFVQG